MKGSTAIRNLKIALWTLVAIMFFGWIGLTNNPEPTKVNVKVNVTNKPALKMMTCYTAFNVRRIYDYKLTDDNKTLETYDGYLYHIEDCSDGSLRKE